MAGVCTCLMLAWPGWLSAGTRPSRRNRLITKGNLSFKTHNQISRPFCL